MGQTSTKTQNAVLPQELNQVGFQHHCRQKTNLKQDNLLRTLPCLYFGSTAKAEEENSCSADKNPVGLIQEILQEIIMKMMTVLCVKSITMTRTGHR
jgi:hypothetical protein